MDFKTATSASTLRFRDLTFAVGKGEQEKYILRDVSGTVQAGRKYKLISFGLV
jgi:hypothetical protein